MDLEELAETAALDVSKKIPGSFVENDGACAFIYLPLTDSTHAIAFVNTLEEGKDARWTVQDDEGTEVHVSEYTATSKAEDVAEWVDGVVESIV